MRSIIEYDTLARRLGLSFLYGYTPQPNKAIYLGYGDLLLNASGPPDGARRGGPLAPEPNFFCKSLLQFSFLTDDFAPFAGVKPPPVKNMRQQNFR